MEDNEIRNAIFTELKNDAELLGLLSPDNVNWSQPEANGTKSPINSIMPMGNYDYPKMAMPLLTVQVGDSQGVDYHLVETVIYIRCYNSSQKSYFDISKILDRVKKDLHRKHIGLSESRFVELIWQMTSMESFDEGYKLPYRESRFVLSRV